MLQQGCHTDHVVFTAVVDAMWDSGVTAAQLRAAAIHRAALRAGLVKPVASGAAVAAATAAASHLAAVTAAAAGTAGGGGEVPGGPGGGGAMELPLGALATGSAVVSFLAFLADQRCVGLAVRPEVQWPGSSPIWLTPAGVLCALPVAHVELGALRWCPSRPFWLSRGAAARLAGDADTPRPKGLANDGVRPAVWALTPHLVMSV